MVKSQATYRLAKRGKHTPSTLLKVRRKLIVLGGLSLILLSSGIYYYLIRNNQLSFDKQVGDQLVMREGSVTNEKKQIYAKPRFEFYTILTQ